MFMRRLFLVCLMFCSLMLQAQDMKSLFVAMPDSLSPLWTEVNRADFGDFLASNMKAKVRNRFGNFSEMLKLTDDYLLMQSSSVSTMEMKLLPLNDSVKVICMVQTYLAPVADSHLSFYDTTWKELPADQFIQLPAEDLFYKTPVTSQQADSLSELRKYADMYLLKASLSEEGEVLSFAYMTPEYLDKETSDRLKPFLRSGVIGYEWKAGKFRPVAEEQR